jgi:anti-sigma-K factor RskA
MRYDRPELRERLAAEYVLGTLHGRARTRFERMLGRDIALMRRVVTWQERLVPLASGHAPVTPSPGVLLAIERRLGFAAARSSRGKWWQFFGAKNLGFVAAGLVMGVGAALLAPLVKSIIDPASVQTTQLPQSYAGILSDAAGAPTMLVSSLRHGSIADIKVLRPITVPSGQRLYLWAVPSEGAAFLLGEVPASGKASIKMAGTSEQLLSKVAQLAVSAETPAAEPPRAPSPFLLRGPCAKFW